MGNELLLIANSLREISITLKEIKEEISDIKNKPEPVRHVEEATDALLRMRDNVPESYNEYRRNRK